MLLRIIIFLVIGLIIYFGIRRIWMDWSNKFKKDEEQSRLARRERDLAERQRPDVIDLKQDKDGTYRPKDKDENRH
ncbi:MAG: hypothetical protein ABS75_09535 [Pelagibacterium sp. SCN 63-23]|jgi:uncharacterized protein YpmB|nr:MAG: hypothetical protein ABS75_09535 [Pelagibacterium sp. SCN 63-23]